MREPFERGLTNTNRGLLLFLGEEIPLQLQEVASNISSIWIYSCYLWAIVFVLWTVSQKNMLKDSLKAKLKPNADGFAGGAENLSRLNTNQIQTTFKVGIQCGNNCFLMGVLLTLLKISYASTIIYAPMALSVKVSLLLILARIYKPFRGVIAVYTILAVNTCYYITILFVKAFSCIPVSTYWTVISEINEACLDRSAVIIADSIISAISDIAILVLPVVFTWPLKMPTIAKIKIIAILGLGGIAIAFSLYRLALVITIGKSQDQTILFMKVLLSG